MKFKLGLYTLLILLLVTNCRVPVSDYDKIQEDDTFNFVDLTNFAPEKSLTPEIVLAYDSKENISLNHSYNSSQIEWFEARYGSALNLIKQQAN